MEYVKQTELYHAINHSLAKLGKYVDDPINREMLLLEQRYLYQRKNMELPSLFEEPWPTFSEVRDAINFCDALEDYRLSTDAYAKNPPEMSEKSVRQIQQGIEQFEPYIEENNAVILKTLKNFVRSRLPEYRDEYVLEQYNNRALLISDLKKQKKVTQQDYGNLAKEFFFKLFNDEEFKSVKMCSQKIEVYTNAINVVDCLSKERYNRTKKFELKSKLYHIISKGYNEIKGPDSIESAKAYDEARRFKKASLNAQMYSCSPEELRRQRQLDEWFYK